MGLRLLQLIKLKGFLKGYHQRNYWSHSTMQYYHIVHKLGTSCLMRSHLISKLAFEIPSSGHWKSHWGFAQCYSTQHPKTPKLKTLFMLNWVPTNPMQLNYYHSTFPSSRIIILFLKCLIFLFFFQNYIPKSSEVKEINVQILGTWDKYESCI